MTDPNLEARQRAIDTIQQLRGLREDLKKVAHMKLAFIPMTQDMPQPQAQQGMPQGGQMDPAMQQQMMMQQQMAQQGGMPQGDPSQMQQGMPPGGDPSQMMQPGGGPDDQVIEQLMGAMEEIGQFCQEMGAAVQQLQQQMQQIQEGNQQQTQALEQRMEEMAQQVEEFSKVISEPAPMDGSVEGGMGELPPQGDPMAGMMG